MLPTDVNEGNMASDDPFSSVKQWSGAMAERGLFDASTARFKNNALDKITSVLGPDEPKTVEYVLQNIEDLTRRWIVLDHANPTTGRTYETRARTLLEDFVAYERDPRAFKGRHKSVRPKELRTTRDEPTPQGELAAPVPPARLERTEPMLAMNNLRSYALEGGGTFDYCAPPTTMTVKDAAKIFYHLATMAHDFDPTDPAIARIFALTPRE